MVTMDFTDKVREHVCIRGIVGRTRSESCLADPDRRHRDTARNKHGLNMDTSTAGVNVHTQESRNDLEAMKIKTGTCRS